MFTSEKGQNDIFLICYLEILLVQNSHVNPLSNQVCVFYRRPIEPNSYFRFLKLWTHKMACTCIPIVTQA
jgi:hypothetical protein